LRSKPSVAIGDVWASIRVVTGSWGVAVVLQVRDHNHLRDILVLELWKVPGFHHSETLLVLENLAVPFDCFGGVDGKETSDGTR